jgi:hypothetical protein
VNDSTDGERAGYEPLRNAAKVARSHVFGSLALRAVRGKGGTFPEPCSIVTGASF